jgi:hypothetical protein
LEVLQFQNVEEVEPNPALLMSIITEHRNTIENNAPGKMRRVVKPRVQQGLLRSGKVEK